MKGEKGVLAAEARDDVVEAEAVGLACVNVVEVRELDREVLEIYADSAVGADDVELALVALNQDVARRIAGALYLDVALVVAPAALRIVGLALEVVGVGVSDKCDQVLRVGAVALVAVVGDLFALEGLPEASWVEAAAALVILRAARIGIRLGRLGSSR